ncbi:P-loop NTPase family protein [Aliarcobacter vitoriensis]|uniref:CobQ/CobB/MinD/ParA nucleotide binding domain-containing protein n=1 Tax=Aliarcobacter vitoriensis TaxID=2011099 RepID=A0A366MU68_9BACT|nr:hypothetical protein [Aliarcobacter vitoriensis]RBQ29801.1 hypothetical protein CRU91_02395 [Aliarcobacter vitoriensis]
MKEIKTHHKSIFCILNSKGGVGKTTVAMQVIAPALYLNHPDKKITVWEIDNNNKSNKHISSKYLKYESIKLDKSEMAINDIEFSNLTDPNTIHVIDGGGSDDSKFILKHLKQVNLTGLQYIIPTNDDIETIENILAIIEIIRQQDKFGKIYLVLNRCVSLTEEKIKQQFINIFGSSELGINSNIEALAIDEILFVENSIVYTLLKSHYKIAMLDFYFESLDLRENIQEYKVQWSQQGHEVFTANSNKFKFSNLVLDLIEKLEPIRKALS